MDLSRNGVNHTVTCEKSDSLQSEQKENLNHEHKSRIPLKRHEIETGINFNPNARKLQSYQRIKEMVSTRIPSSCSVPHSLALSGHSQRSVGQESSYSSTWRGRSSFGKSSAAASFFARAAQRLNLQTARKKKKHQMSERSVYPLLYHRSFGDLLKLSPPPLPPGLLRMSSKRETLGLGKVKVMLRISQSCDATSCITVNTRKKQVTVYDPPTFSTQSAIPASITHQAGINTPKMFAFDAVFTPEDNQSDICATVLMDILPAVVNGTDGCVFSYGYSGLGKTATMLGQGRGSQDVGVIPCAISWLFQLINDQKDKSGSRFSVRVSAVEVAGKEQITRDLLASATEGSGKSPDSFLLANLCGLLVPSAEKTAYLLDVALSARQKQD
ncbi:kinesin-like protein KIF26B [Limulus polyphemus]|uniref:Kinesin-like protein KIF26B n=1 Tax=Limulus polyphemus TaxID=6850 RepID=A0ABM1S2L8_LIMPO|nr:kinesin-like protein KIF26B [Limulus polyphemus]